MDNLVSFPGTSPQAVSPRHPDVRSTEEWLELLQKEMTMRELVGKTQSGYSTIFRQFIEWIREQPGGEHGFYPQLMTQTAVQGFFSKLKHDGRGSSHLNKVKAALKMVQSIANAETWEEPLTRNALQYVKIPVQPTRPPRELSDRQRYILRNLVERQDDPRGAAVFQLGFMAGGRISDVSTLKVADVTLSPKKAVLNWGYKNEKRRMVQVTNSVRRALELYLYGREPGCRSQYARAEESPYVFVSQMGERLTESGINKWFNKLKLSAPVEQYEEIKEITFHDLRHDFAHRMRNEEKWTLEEIAAYLGHTTKSGGLAIQTTVRYTMQTEEGFRKRIEQLDHKN
ncbi:tyrosine-type recombinase/integrase [Paenibacillus shenyangensis]|uniref:tyrosine-type recombinase/integrase n=1 Tax=Paenibacillus sp. A9 TaxID=1284352 RepID=UPI00036D4AEA|nr:site-specific integrase [Paenibacillus sp. A9]